MDALNLEQSTQLCRILGDVTRLRLLMLLEFQELTVAEITEVTDLTQSRVSSHLARLREAELVQDRRLGASAFYSLNRDGIPDTTQELWQALRGRVMDRQVQQDRERAQEVVRRRAHDQTWAESVAGRMEKHYSPGRTWEATARALLEMMELGDVLDAASGDGVFTELIAPRARSVTCLDVSAKVVTAARKRLHGLHDISFFQGDMHKLPFHGASFDQVFLMHALTYTQQPGPVLAEAARVLRPAGRVVATTLRRHEHAATVAAFDHVNQGFEAPELCDWLAAAGLRVLHCEPTSREPRPPYFEVITALARRDQG
jgi:ArsR family transcriptional regulator